MIDLRTLKIKELGAELGLIAALDKRARTVGLHFRAPSAVLASEIGVSESTIRRTLNDFKLHGILKINSEIWLNPEVFGGGLIAKKRYRNEKNYKEY